MENLDPLDFEIEDPLFCSPPHISKRRKTIELDDLLNDHYEEQKSAVKKEERSKALHADDSDEEDEKTREFSKVVDDCQNQVNKMFTEDDIPLWGQKIFGRQKSPPLVSLKEPVGCELLQSFKGNELSSIFEINNEEGFLEGLLRNGWLSQLAFTSGSIEDSIVAWAFYTMLYSSNEELQISACDLWCKVLLSKNEVDQPLVKFGWFPTYSQLIEALEVYGYLSDNTVCSSSVPDEISSDSGCEGPPQNIWSWINIITAFSQYRCIKQFFSTSEAAELLTVIINIFLDRQLQGLLVTLNECMESLINFFRDDEWNVKCKTVACTVASRIPKDLNCVRIVECISSASYRSKSLRSQLAFQMLVLCFNEKVTDGKGVLKVLAWTNPKDQNCDFFKLYIYLVLVENWLLSDPLLQDKATLLHLWCKCLRNCATQITSTDWRPYASKVRNKASYILQNSMK